MKVIIKNNFFSIGGSSEVKDESGKLVYRVKGKLLSPTRVKKVCDTNGNKLFKVRNKWFNFFVHKAYVYDCVAKTKVATVKDKWFNPNNEYFVLGNKDEIKFEGKFFSLDTTIYKNGEIMGHMRRRIDWTDCFELEAEEADMPFLVALVIAVDNIIDKAKSELN